MRIRDLTKTNGEFPDITESASSGGTSAGNVASLANPMGTVNRRPSLFGYIPYEEPKKTKKTRKRK